MTELGDYLRSCRAKVSPEDAGIPSTGHRRVPGLRREELAMLAGVSVDYIVRLEQGRARTASPEVLHALAQALDLRPDEEEYLLRAAAEATGPASRSKAAPPDAQRVSSATRVLLDSMTGVPAWSWAGGWTSSAGTPSGPRSSPTSALWRRSSATTSGWRSSTAGARSLPRLGEGRQGVRVLPQDGCRALPGGPRTGPSHRRAVPQGRGLPSLVVHPSRSCTTIRTQALPPSHRR